MLITAVAVCNSAMLNGTACVFFAVCYATEMAQSEEDASAEGERSRNLLW